MVNMRERVMHLPRAGECNTVNSSVSLFTQHAHVRFKTRHLGAHGHIHDVVLAARVHIHINLGGMNGAQASS